MPATSNTQIAKLVADMDAKLDEHIIATADQESRMASMEKNMERLTEAVIMIAKVEEKISDLEERRQEQDEKIDAVSTKVNDIQTSLSGLVEKVNFGMKISWIVITIFITAIAAQFGLQVPL